MNYLEAAVPNMLAQACQESSLGGAPRPRLCRPDGPWLAPSDPAL